MENGISHDAPAFDPSDREISSSDKYVTVSNGTRRVEVPDGQGYLMAVETTDSNGIPDGRYDLSKAIEANKQGDRSYDGQVIHTDKESVYHLVGEEVVKHSMFELAKHKLPEIGAQLSIAYAGGMPQLAGIATDAYTAQTAPHKHLAPENAEAVSARAAVEKDLQILFAHDPRGIEKVVATTEGDHRALSANVQFDAIQNRVNANPEYAGELKRLSPDLFDKMASADTKASFAANEKVGNLVEAAEKADQAKTLAGKDEKGRDPQKLNSSEQSADRDKEKERRGFSPPQIRTSVEARAHEARDLLTKAHTLSPMIAAKQQRDNAPKAQQNAPKAKRGMSR